MGTSRAFFDRTELICELELALKNYLIDITTRVKQVCGCLNPLVTLSDISKFPGDFLLI